MTTLNEIAVYILALNGVVAVVTIVLFFVRLVFGQISMKALRERWWPPSSWF